MRHVDGQDGGKALTAFTGTGPYLIVSNLGFPTTTDRSAQIDRAQKVIKAQVKLLDDQDDTRWTTSSTSRPT